MFIEYPVHTWWCVYGADVGGVPVHCAHVVVCVYGQRRWGAVVVVRER